MLHPRWKHAADMAELRDPIFCSSELKLMQLDKELGGFKGSPRV